MNPRNLLFVVASVIVVGTFVTLPGQGLTDGVRVTLPHPVTIDDVVLDPGEYEVRMPSSTNRQVLQFFSNDKLRYQTVVQTIPADDGKTPEESKILLHHIGDQYYFDKIWMEGRRSGFEFPLPDKVRALQRELAVTVPAKLESAQETNSSVNAQSADRAQQLPASLSNEPSDRAAVAVPELQSEVADPQEPERQDVAALQREQPETRTPAAAVESRQDNQPVADQLPATASNWIAYLFGGVVLLALAGLSFRASARE